jgi:hypothetical protein
MESQKDVSENCNKLHVPCYCMQLGDGRMQYPPTFGHMLYAWQMTSTTQPPAFRRNKFPSTCFQIRTLQQNLNIGIHSVAPSTFWTVKYKKGNELANGPPEPELEFTWVNRHNMHVPLRWCDH